MDFSKNLTETSLGENAGFSALLPPGAPPLLKEAVDRAAYRASLEFVRTMQETPEAWTLYKEMRRAGSASTR